MMVVRDKGKHELPVRPGVRAELSQAPELPDCICQSRVRALLDVNLATPRKPETCSSLRFPFSALSVALGTQNDRPFCAVVMRLRKVHHS